MNYTKALIIKFIASLAPIVCCTWFILWYVFWVYFRNHFNLSSDFVFSW